MLENSSDAVRDTCKQPASWETVFSRRRHSLTRGTHASDASDSAAAAFPTRVDFAHGAQAAAVCPRHTFFERKYLFDRCMGGVLLVLFSPVILALYVLVRLTSQGPGFYKQERVGLDGKPFNILKLRSMVVNAEKPGTPQWAVKGDARVNLVGRVLRKLHLDELPQLYNVCRGEMSLVGPRPERPQICDRLADQIAGYYDRTAVKPGVTGLAQINLPPDETIDDVRRKQILDLHYIENAAFWLDMRMIIATALRMFGLKGTVITGLMRLDRTHLVNDVKPSSTPAVVPSPKVARPAVRPDATAEPRGAFSPSRTMSSTTSRPETSYYSVPQRPR